MEQIPYKPPVLPPVSATDENCEMSPFAQFLRIVAIITFIAACIIGYNASYVEPKYYFLDGYCDKVLFAIYITIGLLSSIGWWCLSYIVEACIKYLHRN